MLDNQQPSVGLRAKLWRSSNRTKPFRQGRSLVLLEAFKITNRT